ncbi:NADP-dependent oxidoreductase [Nonomuraea sp. NPDC050328]|uniref:NADP-dependent oxidoreductase n=1 Tax=Nonomuraea sp. NPDC050328 TaxID=3364361 RepID=UPI0037ABA852
MKAVAITRFGERPEVMEVPVPTPGPGQVLVRMYAAGLNPFDWKVTDGLLKDVVPHAFPLVMGNDGAGVIEAVGEGVTELRPGEEVYGQFMSLSTGGGSFAEFAVAKAGSVARAPRGLTLSQAAAVPTASMTAYNLVKEARVDAGQTVLVVGATGGVGQGVVQFADAQGARVVATATADLAPLVRELGADEVIDHTASPVADQVRALHPEGLDVLFDLVQDAGGFEAATDLLRPGGMALTTQGVADVDALAEREVHAVNFQNSASVVLLETLADLLDAERYRVRVDVEVPLDQAAEAVARNRAGLARGKTVIKIAGT